MEDLQRTLHPKLSDLPSPSRDLQAWVDIATKHASQWKQLIKLFITNKIRFHIVQWQLGYRSHEHFLSESEATVECPACNITFEKKRALEMHCKIIHAKRSLPRTYVIGSVCPTFKKYFITRPRFLAHLTRGALECTLPWRLGSLPEFTHEQVEAADLFDKLQRKAAKANGSCPGTGIPCRRPTSVQSLL